MKHPLWESDEPEWVSLDPIRVRSVSPEFSRDIPEVSHRFPSIPAICNEVVKSGKRLQEQADEKMKKRLGKRKSSIVWDENEEIKKQESLRQRKKKVYHVGELEKKLGTMTNAIEELNSTINLFKSDNSIVRNQLPPLGSISFCDASSSSSNSSTPKVVRPKRKHGKREKTWEMRRVKRSLVSLFVGFLCFFMLLLPVKVGFSGVLPGENKGFPYGIEGSSKPGMGTGTQAAGSCHKETTPPKKPEKPPARFNSSVFTAGKCIEVFQFRVPPVLGGNNIGQKLRGNPPAKVHKPPVMVVSVLPKKPTEIFVVVAIEGVKYVTYSCSLPQKIIHKSLET